MANYLLVGLGPLGVRIGNEVLRRGDRLSAVVDISPELEGQPLSGLLEGGPDDVRVQRELPGADALAEVDAALVATASDFGRVADTLTQLVDRGVSCASTCEELLWPWERHPERAAELDGRAKASGRTVVGAGVNPGFVMDLLPTLLSASCRQVDAVTIERIQNARPRRVPFQRKIGAGLDLDAFEAKRQEGTLRHVGLGESLLFVGHYLGMQVDRWEESLEPVLAEQPIDCDLGAIPAGHARGVRQVAEGWQGDRRVLRLVFQAAIDQEEPRDRIVLEGDPDLELIIPGAVPGDHATVATLLAAARALPGARPGLLTVADLPALHFHPAGA